MFAGATRWLLLQSTGPEVATRGWMQQIAERIPSAGLSGSQLQALLDDQFPAFSPSRVGAMTLKEAVLQCPDLLQVEESNNLRAKWHVRPVKACAGTSAASLLPQSTKTEAALQKIQQLCSKRAKQGRNTYLPLEVAMARAGVEDTAVVDEVLRRSSHGLDVQAGVRVKPKRLPREIVAFVDGDGLPAVAVDEMCNELNVMKDTSTVTIVRQSGSKALSSVDVICPGVIPTYLCIEKRARELRLRRPDVRQDVVYMCSAPQFDTYAEHVAPLNAFPDADVYVCCPSKVALIQPKKVIPFA